MKRIVTFYVVVFTLTIGFAFGLIYPLYNKAAQGLVSQSVVVMSLSMMMFIPSVAVILTRLITREGFRNANFKPVNFRQTFR